MNNGKLLSPIEQRALFQIGSSLNKYIESLNVITGSAVHIQIEDDERIWKFKHLTIGDVPTRFLVQESEFLEIYIQGSDTLKLLDQIIYIEM